MLLNLLLPLVVVDIVVVVGGSHSAITAARTFLLLQVNRCFLHFWLVIERVLHLIQIVGQNFCHRMRTDAILETGTGRGQVLADTKVATRIT